MYFEKECVLLLFIALLDQLRTVLRELFVEYFSDSCKFSLHRKATSLYLLSSTAFLRQVGRVGVDVRLPGGNQSCDDFGDGHFDEDDNHDVVDGGVGDGDDVKDFCN